MNFIRAAARSIEDLIDLLEAQDADMKTVVIYRANDGFWRGSAKRAW